jgi:hypothetical protein
MIGFRYRVGADWTAYVAMFRMAEYADLPRMVSLGDPGYQLLNYIIQRLGAPFWCVNLVCGFLFTWGLYRLASVEPEPWLAIVVGIPYLVIVVAMGYARQGVAIGILMAGLAELIRTGSLLRYVVYVAIATLFHRTALVQLILVGFGVSRGRVSSTVVVLLSGVGLYFALVKTHVDGFIHDYIKTRYAAQGALIRVLMSVVPATIFLVASKRLNFGASEKTVWRNFSLAAILFLFLYFVLPSSTAVDRLALYVLPLQIVVIGRMPQLLRNEVAGRILVIAYSAAVLFVWLNFAANSIAWVPYKSYLPLPFLG